MVAARARLVGAARRAACGDDDRVRGVVGFPAEGDGRRRTPAADGFPGWGSIVRDRKPVYGSFPERGTFRYLRQPIYLAFALTLWTGPVWDADHLLLAIAWTLYCIAGPVLKERRCVAAYGERFQRYRDRVPYWLPDLRRLARAPIDDTGT